MRITGLRIHVEPVPAPVWCVMAMCLGLAHAHGQTVTLNLVAEVNDLPLTAGVAPIVTPGDIVEWSIYANVSTGDNAGLAAILLELCQLEGNPLRFDIPAARGVPTGMERFSRPIGLSNPGQTPNDPTGYVGWTVGVGGRRNLVQIGGAQNTLGIVNPNSSSDPNAMPNDATIGLGVGQDTEPQLIASGTFEVPLAAGSYEFELRNAIARLIESGPPTSGAVPTIEVTPTIGNRSFRFRVTSIFNMVSHSHGIDGPEYQYYGYPISYRKFSDYPPETWGAQSSQINEAGQVLFERARVAPLEEDDFTVRYLTSIFRRTPCGVVEVVDNRSDLFPTLTYELRLGPPPSGGLLNFGAPMIPGGVLLTDSGTVAVTMRWWEIPLCCLSTFRYGMYFHWPAYDCEATEEAWGRSIFAHENRIFESLQILDQENDVPPGVNTVLRGVEVMRRNRSGQAAWIASTAYLPEDPQSRPPGFDYSHDLGAIIRMGDFCPPDLDVFSYPGQPVANSTKYVHQFAGKHLMLNDQGDIGFSALLRDVPEYPQFSPPLSAVSASILSNSGTGVIHAVAIDGQQVPGQPIGVTFSLFEQIEFGFLGASRFASKYVTMNANGQTAFIAAFDNVNGQSSGIFAEDSNYNLMPIVLAGELLPGPTPDVAIDFKDILFNDTGAIAFTAEVPWFPGGSTFTRRRGIWLWDQGALSLVALANEQAEGYQEGVLLSTGEIPQQTSFVCPILLALTNEGHVYYASGVFGFPIGCPFGGCDDHAIWLRMNDGNIKRVVAVGDDFEAYPGIIRKIKRIQIPHDSRSVSSFPKFLNERGELLLNLEFDDGSEGLYIAHTLGRMDCNGNEIPDDLELCMNDCNSDGIPDECQWIDVNSDGILDECEVCPGEDNSVDTDCDAVPDACDLCEGFSDHYDYDCDGVPDGCDNCKYDYNSGQEDCDHDGIGDICSQDEDANGIPDGCQVRYVDRSTINTVQDGTSWGTAYSELTDALNDWRDLSMVVDAIYVAEGTYYPRQPNGPLPGPSPRNFSFFIPPGLELYGGFPSGGSDFSERDPSHFVTILSGDVFEDDQPGGIGINNNALSVVQVNAQTIPEKEDGSDAVIDGFTIRCGYSLDFVNPKSGAGMIITGRKPVSVRSCAFEQNYASGNGGGIFARGPHDGDGIHIEVVNCRFTDNAAGDRGGAVCLSEADGRIVNVEIARNEADIGGAIVATGESIVKVYNSTIVGNESIAAPAGVEVDSGTQIELTNSILWGNHSADEVIGEATQLAWGDDIPTVRQSLVEGVVTAAFTSQYCFSAEPGFVDYPIDLHLAPGSVCIDMGRRYLFPSDLTTDLDGISRFNDDAFTENCNYFCEPDIWCSACGGESESVIDLGAYEHIRHIIYVDDDSLFFSGASAGIGWFTAYKSLADAMRNSLELKGFVEFRVAQGIYRPSAYGEGDPRTATFKLRPYMRLIGGFRGRATNLSLEAASVRDPALYPSVLSGDLADNDSIDPESQSENSLRVVTANQLDRGTLIDGFTIQQGNLDSAMEGGAGLWIRGGNPLVRQCHVRQNRALGSAGVAITNGATPRIEDCRFTSNIGGGIQIDSASPSMERCVFAGNTGSAGAALRMTNESFLRITNSLFFGNSSISGAGAIDIVDCGAEIAHCTVLENKSADQAGGLHIAGSSGVAIELTVFARNSTNAVISQTTQINATNGNFTIADSSVDDGSPGDGLSPFVNGTASNLTDLYPEYLLDRSGEFGFSSIYSASRDLTTINNGLITGYTIPTPNWLLEFFPPGGVVIRPQLDVDWVSAGSDFFLVLGDDADAAIQVQQIAYERIVIPSFFETVIVAGEETVIYHPQQVIRGRQVDAFRVAGDYSHMADRGMPYRLVQVIPNPNSPTVDYVVASVGATEDIDLRHEARVSTNGLIDIGAIESMPCEEMFAPDEGDAPDSDNDGVVDSCDNCPINANPGQEDEDHDGVGDACDTCISTYGPGLSDPDLDGLGVECDNCPQFYNPSQIDTDDDGVGDVCDNCPSVMNPDQANQDNDNLGDVCDCTNGDVPCGACCYWTERDGALCMKSSEALCDYVNGAWEPERDCENWDCGSVNGQCCRFDGSNPPCIEVSAAMCDAMDGRWKAGSCEEFTCDVGHCCFIEDSSVQCDILSESACLSRDAGSWVQGIVDHELISCDSHGRCCKSDDPTYCEVVSESKCTSQNYGSNPFIGFHWTWGVSCDVQECLFGHCCFVIGGKAGCIISVESACDQIDGVWQLGATCDTSFDCDSHGRCCRFYGGLPSCTVVSRIECETDAESFWTPSADCDGTVNCPVIGGCCYQQETGTKVCEEVTEEICVFLEGSWFGLYHCEDVPCDYDVIVP